MKVDILRQLDGWGTFLQEGIDHVSADEITDAVPELWDESGKRSTRPWWRTSIRLAGALAVFLAIVIAVSGMLGRTVSTEFMSIGRELGGSNNSPAAFGVPTTAAPTTTAAPAATFAPATTSAPGTTRAPVPAPAVPPVGNNPAALGRDVIFVGDMAIDTRDVAGSLTAARAIVESRGGYVFGQELGGRSTVVSLKVPAEFFQDTIDRLSELGTVRSARITSQDVTERIVDLESQIVTTETSVLRLQGLLSEAVSIETITNIESELLQRETTLEQLRGQLRTLQDQVALSTIVLTLREFVPTPDLSVSVSVHAVDNGTGEQCFTSEGPAPKRGDEYVVCVDLTNTGNVPLADLTIRGPADIVSLLSPVSGNRVTTLPAGERYVLWTTAVASEPLRDEVVVQAVPINEDGQRELEARVERRRPLSVTAADVDPDNKGDFPSLRDALSSGWGLLTTGANALAVAAAFMLPFLWIPVLFILAVWRRRRS